MVLSDDSEIVKKLEPRQKSVFLKPRENMKCVLPESVIYKCNDFVDNFNELNVSRSMRNIIHDMNWKEDESELLKITKCILDIL